MYFNEDFHKHAPADPSDAVSASPEEICMALEAIDWHEWDDAAQDAVMEDLRSRGLRIS